MDNRTFLKQLNKGEIRNIYFFYGEEDLLIKQALKLLEQKILPEGLEDFNKDILSGENATPKQIVEMAMNLPFMAEQRLLIVKGPLNFATVLKSDKAGQAALKILLDYMEHPNPQCVLVFVSESDLQKRNVFQVHLETYGEKVSFMPLKGAELGGWIEQYVREGGRNIDRQAVSYLCSVNSFDLQIMEQELNKLLLYRPDEPVLTLQHVRQIVTKTIESTIFDLSDSIGNKKGKDAVRVLHEMFSLGEAPLKVIGFLEYHFRTLVLIKDYQSMGYQEKEIAAKIKKHPYVVKKGLQQIRRFSMKQLIDALEQLLVIEVTIKSTTCNPEELLEQFVVDLCYL